MSEAPDQPGAEAAAAAPATGVEAEAPATTTTTDEDIDTEAFDREPGPDDDEGGEGAGDGQPAAPAAVTGAAADPDEEEVELSDGRKVKVPKEIALGNLRQADYTKKTQELGEARKAFETEQAQKLESLKTFRAEHLAIDQKESSLAAIEKELAEYLKYTPEAWAATKAENPALFKEHADRLDFLRIMRTNEQEALTAAKADLTTKEASLTERAAEAEQANLRTAWSSANATLTKEIPGWGEAKFKEIGNFVMKEFGVTAEQLKHAPDPVPWRMANRLMQAEAKAAKLETQLAQTKTAATTAKAAEVVPAAKPASGSAVPRGVTDSLATESWMDRRNKQVARKRA